jgi:hypothetical protein
MIVMEVAASFLFEQRPLTLPRERRRGGWALNMATNAAAHNSSDVFVDRFDPLPPSEEMMHRPGPVAD